MARGTELANTGDSAVGTCSEEEALHKTWLKRATNSTDLGGGGWIDIDTVDCWEICGGVGRMGRVTCVDVACLEVGGKVEVASDVDIADVEDEAVCGESHYRVNEPSLPLSQF